MRTISVKHCTIKATILPAQENWVAMMVITTTKASIHACIATDKKGDGGGGKKARPQNAFLAMKCLKMCLKQICPCRAQNLSRRSVK
jgi:hypothetical protein